MDEPYPINRIAQFFEALGDAELVAAALLSEFTSTAIEFVDSEAGQELKGSSPRSISDKAIHRLLALVASEARSGGAVSVIFEPRHDSLALSFKYADGRCVERDAPPRRLLRAIRDAARSLAGNGTIIELDGQQATVEFFETPHGEGLSLHLIVS